MTERSEGTVVGDGADDGGAASIGGTLAKARRDAGMTVGQVADRTRIRETVINAIERDDYTLCGGNFYARGHIRSIARAAGIDPEPLIDEYDDAHGGSPQAIPARQAFEPETPVRFRERRAPNWSAAMIVALVLVAIYGIVRVATGHDEHRSAQRAAAPATATPASRSRATSPSPAAGAAQRRHRPGQGQARELAQRPRRQGQGAVQRHHPRRADRRVEVQEAHPAADRQRRRRPRDGQRQGRRRARRDRTGHPAELRPARSAQGQPRPFSARFVQGRPRALSAGAAQRLIFCRRGGCRLMVDLVPSWRVPRKG